MNRKPKKYNNKGNDGSSAVAKNYHLPDRTFSDFFCKACNSHMNSSQMWDSHIQGKRHQKKVKDLLEKPQEKETAPPAIPLIENRLIDISDPIVGLKYICEIRKADLLLGPTYKCFLCSGSFATGDVLLEHLASAKHILAYWKEVEHNTLKPFEGFSKGALENIAYDRAVKLEQKYGRGIMQVEFEKKATVLPPPKSKYSDEDRSPPRKRKADFSDDEGSVDFRSKSYTDRSPLYERRAFSNRSPSHSPPPFRNRSPLHTPPPLPSPRSDLRDHLNARAQEEFLRTHRDWERSEREAYDRNRDRYEAADMLRRSMSQRDEMLTRERYEPMDRSIPREEPLSQDRYERVDTAYRRIMPRDEQPIRDLNSYISRSELMQPQQSCPPPSRQQSTVSNSSPFNTSEDKSPTLKDFIEAIKLYPASYASLLEKMGPFEITNDEECQRLYDIAKHIDSNIVQFMMLSLNAEQHKQLARVIQGQNSNSDSNVIIPGINDDSSIERRNNTTTAQTSSSQWFR